MEVAESRPPESKQIAGRMLYFSIIGGHAKEPGHTQCWYRIWYRELVMETARKITIVVPPDLLQKAQSATGSGITQTVRTGLELVAASEAYARLRQFRGKVRFTRTSAELKADR